MRGVYLPLVAVVIVVIAVMVAGLVQGLVDGGPRMVLRALVRLVRILVVRLG